MKHKQTDYISKIMFTENFTIPFFKCRENWERAGIQILHILVGHLFEMI